MPRGRIAKQGTTAQIRLENGHYENSLNKTLIDTMLREAERVKRIRVIEGILKYKEEQARLLNY